MNVSWGISYAYHHRTQSFSALQLKKKIKLFNQYEGIEILNHNNNDTKYSTEIVCIGFKTEHK